jgi:hypothetical protein
MMSEPMKKEENPLAFLEKKEEKPKEAVKKIATNLKQFEKKPNTPDRMTSREAFLQKANKEKNPEKRKAIIAALRGRMFQ